MAKTKEEKLLSKRLLELDAYRQVIKEDEKASITLATTDEEFNFLVDLLKERLTPKTSHPNEDLDIEDFNYKQFDASTPEKIANFLKYIDLATNLPMNKSFMYDKFYAGGIFKWKINEDTAEREKYLAGIKFIESDKLSSTLTQSKNANNLNRMIYSSAPKPIFLLLQQC